jgi:asparagine synthase (glutamine-hydrolysing)
MSGIAAIGLRHEAPIDPQLLASMERVLAQRGPDRGGQWTGERFALVHTLFRTVDESAREEQPLTFDGRVWITADARIDAREELVRELRAHDRAASLLEPDVHLILHAYHVWGTACLEHLLGDFAFAIVDRRTQRLFAARDHLGVKPLFWAGVPDGIMVSNMLDCVRRYPQVSDTLNDSFICDFLLFGWNTDVAASAFADIHRLPPAHRLEWTPEGMRIERYWTLTIPEIVRRRRQRDYIEAFTEVLRQAIADRLRTDKVVISLSGGMDSASIAATMMPLLARRSPPTAVQAVTAVYDRLIPDQERYYAGLVARHLGIPIEFVAGDDLECFGPDWDTAAAQYPEPAERGLPLPGVFAERLGAHGRVVLSGDGGDEVVSAPHRYFHKLLREGRYGRLLIEYYRDSVARPKYRLWDVWARCFIRIVQPQDGWSPPIDEFPEWIDPDLVRRFDLHSHWKKFWQPQPTDVKTPPGHLALSSYLLPHALANDAASGQRVAVESRYPYLDLRVIQCVWSLPVIPFRYAKFVSRKAVLGTLPRQVVERPKKALAGDPCEAVMSLVSRKRCLFDDLATEVSAYCVRGPMSNKPQSTGLEWAPLRAFELASWLRHRRNRQATY